MLVLKNPDIVDCGWHRSNVQTYYSRWLDTVPSMFLSAFTFTYVMYFNWLYLWAWKCICDFIRIIQKLSHMATVKMSIYQINSLHRFTWFYFLSWGSWSLRKLLHQKHRKLWAEQEIGADCKEFTARFVQTYMQMFVFLGLYLDRYSF